MWQLSCSSWESLFSENVENVNTCNVCEQRDNEFEKAASDSGEGEEIRRADRQRMSVSAISIG